ncbi:ATP-binding protein [Candidatus Dependentiae bacterium]|nr:ATP-binding protein [Candidatus Dependentiae bacterium]
MNHKRIALIGSHGTGKTSIIERLAEITKLPVIEELARNYNMNTSDLDEYKFFQKQLLLEQIKAEMALKLSNGSFISDRSTIDNMAYFLLKCEENSTPEERTRYADIAIKNALLYDYIFYVPIEFEMDTSNEFRFKDILFQREIDEKILHLIKLFEINVTVVKGSLDERVSTIIDVIKWR